MILIGGLGGFILGFTVDPYFEGGFYAPSLARFLIKAGHSHGMPMAFFNLIVGPLVDRLNLSDKGKKYLSYLTLGSFIMPVGLLLRGFTGGAMTFAPVVLIGALCFLSSAALIAKGSLAK
ncbi:MAG: hypothetical protein V3S46_01885 [Nitrospinota bacterium]